MVWVTYAKDERIKWKREAQVRRVMDGFSARLVVRHGQTAQEIRPHPRPHNGPTVYRKFLPEGFLFYVDHTLFIFRASGFGWRYDDEIGLILEVLSPVQDSYLRSVKAKLTVHELTYLF